MVYDLDNAFCIYIFNYNYERFNAKNTINVCKRTSINNT